MGLNKQVKKSLFRNSREMMIGEVFDGETVWIAEVYDLGDYVFTDSKPIFLARSKDKKSVLQSVLDFLNTLDS